MVLLGPSVAAIRRLLCIICDRYAQNHGLLYNAKKSEYLVFKAGGKCPESVPPLLLNGSALNRVYTFEELPLELPDLTGAGRH